MVRSNLVMTQSLGKLMRYTFGHAAGVDENQGGVVLLDHVGDLVEQFSHHLSCW